MEVCVEYAGPAGYPQGLAVSPNLVPDFLIGGVD